MVIPTGYGLYGPGLEFRQREEIFSLPVCLWSLHSLLFYGNRSSLPGLELPEHEKDYSPPSTAKVNMSGTVPLIAPSPPYVFMAWAGKILPLTLYSL